MTAPQPAELDDLCEFDQDDGSTYARISADEFVEEG